MRHAHITLLLGILAPVAAFASSPAGSTVSADAALKLLRDGNARFAAGECQHPHCDKARLIDTDEHGQHPFATIVACSDSRVPVEILFDEGFGDLFVIRVAGNVCDTDEAGSVEYGVGHLGTHLLVVLGHTSCGAVTAVATHAELHGNIPQLVDNIKPAVEVTEHQHPELKGKEFIEAAVRTNVWHSIEDLLRISEETRELISTGKLQVIGAIYDLHSGRVEFMGPHPHQKELLEKAEKSGHGADAPAVHPERGAARIWGPAALALAAIGLAALALRLRAAA